MGNNWQMHLVGYIISLLPYILIGAVVGTVVRLLISQGVKSGVEQAGGIDLDPETIRFACPKCGNVITTPAKNAGRGGACKKCGERIVVPGDS